MDQVSENVFCFVFGVIIGMSPNSPKQLYFPKDNYKQKQCDILSVRMITGNL